MSLNLKDAKKGMSGPLSPVGNHIARCYQIIDLGTQDDQRYGNASHKIRFVWELCEELHDFGKGKKEPFSVSMQVNFFFGSNSNFTKLLEGWKGGTFTDAQLDAFEIKNLLGKPCMINVVHNSTADRDYANVASVSPLPAKWKDRVPPLYNAPIYFETEMGPTSAEFRALPEFLQKTIEKCHEWRGSATGLPPSAKNDIDDNPFADDEETEKANAEATAAAAKRKAEEEADDIPF